jgi:UV DNA damage repair endonuclease
MARWMGFGAKWQDFKINVHISGREGPEGIRAAYKRLSPEARNCITIENEEITHGIEHTLNLSDIIPTVLDIHHNWVREGEYINPGDDRCKRVIDSWRGTRPVIHYSCSREELLEGHNASQAPDREILIESGISKQKLRAHSDFYWNTATNAWALSFLDDFDIQCESKGKNLASFALHKVAKDLNIL